jgi:MerR family transcriptional regulator, light-induced transcriptional regulator
MVLLDTTPTYNLKVVIQETGIKPDTLRAWERRYGLPQPGRTSGGHRLYSQRDIETVKWLLSRQEEGLSISRAVELWQSIEEDGRNPLQEVAYDRGDNGISTTIHIRPPALGSAAATQDLDEIRAVWVEACLAFDEAAAERIVKQALAIFPSEAVCLRVLQAGISEIGSGWYANQVTVQQEHFASALAMRQLNALLAAAPPPTRTRQLLIACPPGENHTFSTLLLTLMLRYRGWAVVYLGANVPIARLEATIEQVKPQLIILTAQQLYSAAMLYNVATFLQGQEVKVAYGGLIFNHEPSIQQRMPGRFLGETFEEAVQTVEPILDGRVEVDDPEPVPDHYRTALAHYLTQQATIESTVWDEMQVSDVAYEHLKNANYHFSQNIIAAFILGDLRLLSAEITWLEHLLTNYGLEVSSIGHYLAAYYQAAKAHLDERGQMLVDWLAQAAEQYR